MVPSEVKALATQTAKATEEISAQITEVQSATRQAVEKVGAIAAIIGDIDGFTASISTAVSQQNAAAAEISRVSGTRLPARHRLRAVSPGRRRARGEGATAGLVLATAHDLSDQAMQLRSSVDRFLSNVAA